MAKERAISGARPLGENVQRNRNVNPTNTLKQKAAEDSSKPPAKRGRPIADAAPSPSAKENSPAVLPVINNEAGEAGVAAEVDPEIRMKQQLALLEADYAVDDPFRPYGVGQTALRKYAEEVKSLGLMAPKNKAVIGWIKELKAIIDKGMISWQNKDSYISDLKGLGSWLLNEKNHWEVQAAKLQEAEAELLAKHEELTTLLEDVTKFKSLSTELEAKVEVLEREKAALKSTLEARIVVLENELTNVGLQRDAAAKRLEALEGQLEKIQEDRVMLERKNSALEEEQRVERASWARERETNQREIEGQQAAKQQQKVAFEREQQAFEREIKALHAAKQEQETAFDREREAYKREISALQAAKEEQKSAIERERESFQREVGALQTAKQEQKTAFDWEKEVLVREKHELTMALEKETKIAAKVPDLEKELQEKGQELKNITEAAISNNGLPAYLSGKLKILEKENKELKERLKVQPPQPVPMK